MRSDRPHDLLAAIGRDCIGAMPFLPRDNDSPDPFQIEGTPQNAADIAVTIRDLAMSPPGPCSNDTFHISLVGTREKTAFLWLDGPWLNPAGPTPTTHVFKRRMAGSSRPPVEFDGGAPAGARKARPQDGHGVTPVLHDPPKDARRNWARDGAAASLG